MCPGLSWNDRQPCSRTGGKSNVRRAKIVAPWRMGRATDVDTGKNSPIKALCC